MSDEPNIPPGAMGEASPPPAPEVKGASDIPPPLSFEAYQKVASPSMPEIPLGTGTSADRTAAAEAFADLIVQGRHRIAVLSEYQGFELGNGQPDASNIDRKPYVVIFGYLLKHYKWDPTMVGVIFAGVTIVLETAVTAFGYVKWRHETGRDKPKEAPKK